MALFHSYLELIYEFHECISLSVLDILKNTLN